MTALELAKFIDEDADMGADEYFKAADMLRRQHEAIVKLRKALDLMTAAYPTAFERGIAVKALKDTEDLT